MPCRIASPEFVKLEAALSLTASVLGPASADSKCWQHPLAGLQLAQAAPHSTFFLPLIRRSPTMTDAQQVVATKALQA